MFSSFIKWQALRKQNFIETNTLYVVITKVNLHVKFLCIVMPNIKLEDNQGSLI